MRLHLVEGVRSELQSYSFVGEKNHCATCSMTRSSCQPCRHEGIVEQRLSAVFGPTLCG